MWTPALPRPLRPHTSSGRGYRISGLTEARESWSFLVVPLDSVNACETSFKVAPASGSPFRELVVCSIGLGLDRPFVPSFQVQKVACSIIPDYSIRMWQAATVQHCVIMADGVIFIFLLYSIYTQRYIFLSMFSHMLGYRNDHWFTGFIFL